MSIYDLIIAYLILPLGSYILYARARRHIRGLLIQQSSEVNLATGIVFSVYSILGVVILTLLKLGWSETFGLCLAVMVIVGGAMMLVATSILFPYRFSSGHLGGIFIGGAIYALIAGALAALGILGLVCLIFI